MDGIRLVAIAEPVAGAGSAGAAPTAGAAPMVEPGPASNVGPASTGWPRVATGEGIGQRDGGGVSDGPAVTLWAGPDVLDRVVGSRLDRVGTAVRWGIGAGGDDASASAHAELALRSARECGTGLGFATGDPWRDALLADLGLALAALLDDLTPRQAEIASLILVDRARQAEVAAALGVSRATVSVAVARGRLLAIAGARRAIEALLVGPPVAGSGRGADGESGSRSR